MTNAKKYTPGRDRTDGHHVKSVALCRLSYEGNLLVGW